MAERRMLREAMRIHDIYNYAEPIIDMLRERYGSYDADSLDEVLIDASFAQLLKERGYNVQVWSDSADAAEEEQAVAPAPEAAPTVRRAPVTSTMGTSRPRTRATSSAATTGESTEGRTRTTTSRTRRTTSASSGEEAPRTTRRTTRTTRTAANETEPSGT